MVGGLSDVLRVSVMGSAPAESFSLRPAVEAFASASRRTFSVGICANFPASDDQTHLNRYAESACSIHISRQIVSGNSAAPGLFAAKQRCSIAPDKDKASIGRDEPMNAVFARPFSSRPADYSQGAAASKALDRKEPECAVARASFALIGELRRSARE